jgi:hypothetical protein
LGNVATGGFSLGACYQDANASTFVNTFKGNVFSNGLVLAGGPYRNTTGPFIIRRGNSTLFPEWVVPGLIITPDGTVQPGTTIASVNANAGTITLNQPILGTIVSNPNYAWSFKDLATGFAVGGMYFRFPAGNQHDGTYPLRTYVATNQILAPSYYEDIEMNPGGGTIALTINNDASFGAPSHGTVYRITQTGTGTANITAGSATVNGVTGTTIAMAVGGQYKVAYLRYVGVDTWIVYQ